MAELPQQIAVEQIGAVGHFVSAMLQTAGLDGQSVVLSYMSPIIEKIGVLFYLVAVITALISIALYGNYKKGLYLFIAPGIFFFMLKTTVPATGTLVRFGNRTVSSSPKAEEKMINMFINNINLGTDSTATPQISWFYVVYDNLVTSVVQGLVAFLLDTENRQDLVIAGRERVYGNILKAESHDPKFMRLLAIGLMGRCSRPSTIANEAAGIDKDDSSTSSTRSGYNQSRINAAKNTIINIDHELVNYLLDQKIITDKSEVANGISCFQAWDFVTKAAKNEANLYRKKLQAQQKATQSKDQIPEETWEKIWKEVDATLGAKLDEDGNVDYTTTADPAKVNDVLAAIIIRNNLLKNPQSMLTAQMFERAPFNNEEMSMVYNDLGAADASSLVVKLTYFAALLPYIQGLFLMILTVVFPFFCVFLLMPGRYITFFMWMTTWLWVKSWDVGFAIIVFLKDFLWQFLSRDISHNVTVVNWDDPSAIFEFIGTKDPIATPSTYASIISILTLAVPVLTSELCMGASSLAGIFKSATEAATSRFGDQQYKGGEREYTTSMNYIQQRGNYEAGVANAKQAFEQPGEVNGVARNKTGDDTHARYIGYKANASKFNTINSQQGYMQALYEAGTEKRTQTPNSNFGPTAMETALNPLSEKYRAAAWYNKGAIGTNIVGSGQDKDRKKAKVDFSEMGD